MPLFLIFHQDSTKHKYIPIPSLKRHSQWKMVILNTYGCLQFEKCSCNIYQSNGFNSERPTRKILPSVCRRCCNLQYQSGRTHKYLKLIFQRLRKARMKIQTNQSSSDYVRRQIFRTRYNTRWYQGECQESQSIKKKFLIAKTSTELNLFLDDHKGISKVHKTIHKLIWQRNENLTY